MLFLPSTTYYEQVLCTCHLCLVMLLADFSYNVLMLLNGRGFSL